MSFKPALGGCFLILLIITIILFFYHKRVSLPDFSVRWRQVHLENSRHFENWQRERTALTRRWLSKMRARYELWKKLLIEDADMHFAHGDEIMKKLLFGREVNQSTAENLKRARKKELLKLAKEAEVIKDYTRAGNYYHKAGEVEKAKKMHELARGTRQYVQIGTIDRSITIKDSVVQRSKVGVEPAFSSPLAELYQLVEKGILTEEEFEKAKKKLLE
ncbi:MAG TPA: hypothetical protein EYP29_03460 [Thermoplasmata archaeon]|nr:hypothetical protein [Thermoplasmata archaeon]